MPQIVTLLLILLVMVAFLLGLSIGVAFLLHWLIPVVTLDMALLIGVIAVGLTMLSFAQLTNAMALRDATEADEEGSQARPIVILDPELPLPRRRRKRG